MGLLTDEQLFRLCQWCREQSIRLCVLFGSQASGQTHDRSDIDLALWPHQVQLADVKLRWWSELERLLDQKVSLVLVSPAVDPLLGFEIVRAGRVIYEREDGLWQQQRLQLWRLYTDTAPLRQLERQKLREFAESVQHGA
jgi:predicted nucleotidyltransferase